MSRHTRQTRIDGMEQTAFTECSECGTMTHLKDVTWKFTQKGDETICPNCRYD